jgi:putative hydrolase of the HAD superfamily
MTFDAIIFDLGGVILNIDYNKTISAFKKLGMENFDELFSQAKQSSVFDDFETGKISAQHFINKLLPCLKSGTSPNAVVHAWNEMVLNVPLEKLELLEKLKAKYPVYLLSNTNELHIPVVRKKWAEVTDKPMEHYFNHLYFSNEIHMRKPNAEIFNFVAKNEKLNPESTLFIDDSIQHIEGAKKLGYQTIHLKNQEDLYSYFS